MKFYLKLLGIAGLVCTVAGTSWGAKPKTDNNQEFYTACEHGDLDTVKKLIGQVDINGQNNFDNRTGLMQAIIQTEKKTEEVVDYILDNQSKLKTPINPNLITLATKRTLLLLAIRGKNSEAARKILQLNGIDRNKVDSGSATALYYALDPKFNIDFDVIYDLAGAPGAMLGTVDLNKPADKNINDAFTDWKNLISTGNNPLHIAIILNEKEKADLLAKQGSKYLVLVQNKELDTTTGKFVDNNTQLMLAIQKKWFDLANKMVTPDQLNIDAQNLAGNNALLLAIANSDGTDEAKKLIDALMSHKTKKSITVDGKTSEIEVPTIDLAQENKKGETALKLALDKKDYDLAFKIMSSGRDFGINAIAKFYPSLAYPLIKEGKDQVKKATDIEPLFKTNVKTLQVKHGDTPLHYAIITKKMSELNNFLSDPNTKLNERNKRQETPLMLALKNKLFDIAKTIIESGRDYAVNAVDQDGNTALNYAIIYADPNSTDLINELIGETSVEQLNTPNNAGKNTLTLANEITGLKELNIQIKTGKEQKQVTLPSVKLLERQIQRLKDKGAKAQKRVKDPQDPLLSEEAKKTNQTIDELIIKAGQLTDEDLNKILATKIEYIPTSESGSEESITQPEAAVVKFAKALKLITQKV